MVELHSKISFCFCFFNLRTTSRPIVGVMILIKQNSAIYIWGICDFSTLEKTLSAFIQLGSWSLLSKSPDVHKHPWRKMHRKDRSFPSINLRACPQSPSLPARYEAGNCLSSRSHMFTLFDLFKQHINAWDFFFHCCKHTCIWSFSCEMGAEKLCNISLKHSVHLLVWFLCP